MRNKLFEKRVKRKFYKCKKCGAEIEYTGDMTITATGRARPLLRQPCEKCWMKARKEEEAREIEAQYLKSNYLIGSTITKVECNRSGIASFSLKTKLGRQLRVKPISNRSGNRDFEIEEES